MKDKSSKPKRRGFRIFIITLLMIAALAAAAIAGYTLWEKPPDITKPAVTEAPAPGKVQEEASKTEENPIEEEEILPEEAINTQRNDGVFTFLLVGRDHESNSTDTIIVGKLDTVKHSIDCVNIPRDTLINISWGNTPKKINTVYPGYTNSGKSGIEGLRSHISKLTGFDVDCYAVVNLRVVEDVINEVGGIYFDVPIDMDYDDGAQHFHVHLKKGYQLLNGYETLGVFRYRYGNDGNTYPGGDLERIGVQQNLMKSIAAQMLSLGNIPNLSNIIDLVVKNVETDLSAANIAYFARQFLLCNMENINFRTAPTNTGFYINDVSYLSLQPQPWLEMVNEYLNPYTEDITESNVSIITADSTGTVIYGEVAGGIESFYCNTMGCELRYTGHAPGVHVFPEPEPVEGEEGLEGEETEGEEGEEPTEGENAGDASEGPEVVESTGGELSRELCGYPPAEAS